MKSNLFCSKLTARNLPILILTFSILLFTSIGLAQGSRIDPQDVTIKRDTWGVPHIYGEKDVHVAYGLAYANAEDAFKEMQEMFILGKGLNGRYQGKDGAKTDYVLHALNIPEIVEDQYEAQLSAEFRDYLDAYCQGANRYAEKHPKEVVLKNLFPINGKDIIKAYALFVAIESHVDKTIKTILSDKVAEVDLATDLSKGSNGMVISGEMMEDGKTTLMMNPHLPMYGLASMFEAHMVSNEGLNIHGAIVHGGVSCFLGVNENLGWTSTTNNIDKNDTYQLEINPANKLQYNVDGEWLILTEKKQKLKVKILGAVVGINKKMYTSIYGPTFITKTGTYSIAYACYDRIMAGEQYFLMGKTKNLKEFKDLFSMQGIPDENFIYGDRKQNIYLMNNTPLPIKDADFDYTNTLPGNTLKSKWSSSELLSSDKMLQYTNPPCGYLYNNNHSPQWASSPCYELPDDSLSVPYMHDWKKDNNRSLTIKNFLEEKNGEKISLSELKELKNAQYIPSNSPFLNIYHELMSYEKSAEFISYNQYFETLKGWDFNFDKSSKPSTLFTLVTKYIWENTNSGREILYTKPSYSKEVYLEAFKYTKRYLSKHFKGEIIPLGSILKHKRGDRTIGIGGFADVLALIYPIKEKDGTLKAYVGESVIMFIQFAEDRITIESVVPYGSSCKADSKHYTDQMDLFTSQKLKTVSLYEDEILPTIERSYHPE